MLVPRHVFLQLPHGCVTIAPCCGAIVTLDFRHLNDNGFKINCITLPKPSHISSQDMHLSFHIPLSKYLPIIKLICQIWRKKKMLQLSPVSPNKCGVSTAILCQCEKPIISSIIAGLNYCLEDQGVFSSNFLVMCILHLFRKQTNRRI